MSDEDELLDTLLRLTGQPVPERPKPEAAVCPQECPHAIHYDDGSVICVVHGVRTDPAPPRPQAPRGGPAMATPKQIAFLRKLIAERDGFEHVLSGVDSGLSKKEASKLIDEIMQTPRRAQPTEARAERIEKATKELAEVGYYARDGEFYTVVNSKHTDRRYAKKLTISTGPKGNKVVRWEYAPGMVLSFTPDELLTLDQAKAFGHLHGHCIICCRPLHDPKSVEAGIGPDCTKTLTKGQP